MLCSFLIPSHFSQALLTEEEGKCNEWDEEEEEEEETAWPPVLVYTELVLRSSVLYILRFQIRHLKLLSDDNILSPTHS